MITVSISEYAHNKISKEIEKRKSEGRKEPTIGQIIDEFVDKNLKGKK